MRSTLIAATLLACHVCSAQPTLSVTERAALQKRSAFRMLGAAEELPKDVFALCADHNGLLAAPGSRWNPGDVMARGVASRRVIWASRSESLMVVHYEQGGFTHSRHVAVLRVRSQPSGYELAWRAQAPWLRGYGDFVKALDANALRAEGSPT